MPNKTLHIDRKGRRFFAYKIIFLKFSISVFSPYCQVFLPASELFVQIGAQMAYDSDLALRVREIFKEKAGFNEKKMFSGI